nr:Ada metal-binding domain-containing protein [Lacticaseibacillus manihotivorans]
MCQAKRLSDEFSNAVYFDTEQQAIAAGYRKSKR